MASQTNEPVAIDEDVLKEISQILAQIQYGSLEISVQNGRIVQLERREKKRFDKSEKRQVSTASKFI